MAVDEHGNTPLIWAANHGSASATEFLLASDSTNIDARGFLGATALARAARGGHKAVTELLLEAGANPNIPNEKQQYPLHFAAFKKHPEIVRLLLVSGRCDLTVTDRKGRTPDMDTSDEAIKNMILDHSKATRARDHDQPTV
jgi:ankyrin repeat protein